MEGIVGKGVRIWCKNTSAYVEAPAGASLLEVYAAAGRPTAYRPMNATVNGRVEALTERCRAPAEVQFADYTSPSGQRTYVRSLCHILSKAVADVLPQADLRLEYPISKGYFCTIRQGERGVGKASIQRIKERMQALIDADIPFKHTRVPAAEAIALFRRRGMEDKARLIETAGLTEASYYELDGYVNFFYSCLTPSTGYIRLFDLVPYFDGALLQAPSQDNPETLEPVVKKPKLFEVYKESLTLLHTLGLNNVGDLNKAIADGFTSEIVLVSEAMQEKQIAQIAERIARRNNNASIILVAGPSSSGKTTFARRLGIQLLTNSLRPVSISLDNYFLNRRDTPRNDYGDYDFESLYALDLPYLNDDIQKLLAGNEIPLPTYDFTTGQRKYKGDTLKLPPRSALIIEGIHALNPKLTARIDNRHKYKIYVSALTAISLDNHNWIPTADNRLLRRIVRDHRYRNYSAQETIARWANVRRGEDQWIIPQQPTADDIFNSAMLYELAALRPFAEPILAEVPTNDDATPEARRLLRFLRYFHPIPAHQLPPASLLREFLGGSPFKY